MKKLPQFFSFENKYFKIFLIGLVVLGLVVFLTLIFLFRNYIYENTYLSYLSRIFTKTNTDSVVLEKVNNKIVNEESVIIDVVAKAGDSVVSIVVLEDIFQEDGESIGSGVVIDSNGLIITNKHVVEDEDLVYQVVTNDGKTYRVEEVIRDKAKDLALIKVSASDLKPITLSGNSDLKLGQRAIAVGNALGFSNSVSVGIVSGLSREVEIDGEIFRNLIQTDAAINLGNSGGALLNSNGDLIGINTAKSSFAENIGFAIPIESVTDLISRYQRGEINKNSVPAFLGIGFVFRDLGEYVKKGLPIGPVITGVLRNSPADKAGLKVGDIIVSIDDTEFSDEYELSQFIKQKNPGDRVSIKVYRKNGTINLDAVLTEATVTAQ